MSQSEYDRFPRLFDQSGVPQAVVALDGTIAAVNAATCALFDRTPDELIGGRDSDARLLAAVLSGETERAQFERRMDHRDGRWLDTLVSVSAIHDDDGTLREISVCLQDITALKTAQRAAERAEARWRSLSQNASDIALIVGAELDITYMSSLLEGRHYEVLEAETGTQALDQFGEWQANADYGTVWFPRLTFSTNRALSGSRSMSISVPTDTFFRVIMVCISPGRLGSSKVAV